MNRYLGGRTRRRRGSDNPFWKNIEHAHNALAKLSLKEQNFVSQMKRNGPDFNMTEPQIRWLNAIMQKVYK